jgi:dihydrofolate synthase/folylpolyglutamate synthase
VNAPAAQPSASLGELVARLSVLHPKSIDLGLERMQRVLERLDHPERRLPPVIHVAGTNGKGSTIAYMRAILEAAGLRVHVYTLSGAAQRMLPPWSPRRRRAGRR